jgi:DNA-binding transcriptional LysR family regulator
MHFNSVEGPIIAALSGLGIMHSVDLLVAEQVARGDLKLILREYSTPGAVMSLVHPSAGHQSPKVRVFSDFAADLMKRFQDMARGWLDPALSKAPP